MILFAGTSDSSSIGVFGSIAPGGGGATYSKVIATVQSLNAWGSGWKAEVVSPLRPAIQDFNAVDYVFSYGICYLHEMGIPEYDSGTVYYTYSICQYNGVIYQSLSDDNVGNTPTPGAYWSVLSYVDLTTNQTVAGIKTFSSFPVTPSSAPTTNYQVANKKYVDDNKTALIGGASVQVIGTTDQTAPGSEGDMPDMSVTLTTVGTKLFCTFVAPFYRITRDTRFYFKIAIDGVNKCQGCLGSLSGTTDIDPAQGALNWLEAGLTPGSHTVKVRWLDNPQGQYGSTLQRGSSDGQRILTVIDLP